MVLHDQWPNSSLTASVWRGIGVNMLISCPFGCVSKNQKTKTYHIWRDTGTQTTKKKRTLSSSISAFKVIFGFCFLFFLSATWKNCLYVFFWDCPGRHHVLSTYLSGWELKTFSEIKNCFCLFSDTKGYRETAFDSTLSVLPFQYNTFMAWIASSCLLTASACAHSRLRLVLISSPELRFWLRSYRPRNTFFPPEYAWVDLYYSFYLLVWFERWKSVTNLCTSFYYNKVFIYVCLVGKMKKWNLLLCLYKKTR